MPEVWNAVNRLDLKMLHKVLNARCMVDESGGYFVYDRSIRHTCDDLETMNQQYPRHVFISKKTPKCSPTKYNKRIPATPLQLLINKALNDPYSPRLYEIYLDILNVLLKHKANTEVLCKSGKTPLMELVSMRLIEPGDHLDLRLEMVSKLLHFGANINTISSSRLKPIAIAIYGKWIDMIILLILHGADVHAICDMKWSRTPTQCGHFLFYMDHVCRDVGMEEHTIRATVTGQIQNLIDDFLYEYVTPIKDPKDAQRFTKRRNSTITSYARSFLKTLSNRTQSRAYIE
jgi:hypothetical protein